jgi:hypothetical protein
MEHGLPGGFADVQSDVVAVGLRGVFDRGPGLFGRGQKFGALGLSGREPA